MNRTPLLLVGDGPNEPTGLGRIARDLASLIVQSDLPVDLVQVGGPALPVWQAWRHVPMHEQDRAGDWGAAYVAEVWRSCFGRQPGICWYLWDPARIFYHLQIELPAQRWGYLAIDAANRQGRITGPAGEAVRQLDRVIAYGRWGSEILRAGRDGAVSYLPHGIVPAIYAAPASVEERAWVDQILGPYRTRGAKVIGCIATNQPRKDLPLFFETLQELQRRGHAVYGWLHTDVLVKAWSVPQLVEDAGLAHQVTVSLESFTDRQLACLYQACAITIAPGLGEGFGYPIVESLASGTPAVHADYAGGAELLPAASWRLPVRAERIEGVYAVRRPLLTAVDAANAIERIWRWREQLGEPAAAAYCRGAVAHLDWQALWPRWQAWMRKGL